MIQKKESLLELVDPEVRSECCEEEALTVLNVVLLCTSASPTRRPSMSEVVSLLEGRMPLQPLLSSMGLLANASNSNGVGRNFCQNLGKSQTTTVDASYADSSTPVSVQEDDAITQLVYDTSSASSGTDDNGVRRNFWQDLSESQTLPVDASYTDSSAPVSVQEHDTITQVPNGPSSTASRANDNGVRRSFWQNPSESQTVSVDASCNGSSVLVSV